jgi:hypothetical protein
LRESPDLAVFRIIEKTSLCAAVTVRLLWIRRQDTTSEDWEHLVWSVKIAIEL